MARRRKALGISQAALARTLADQGLAFHQQTVQRIEGGDRPVRLNEAVLIVRALGMGGGGALGLDDAILPQSEPRMAQIALREAVVRAGVTVLQAQQEGLQAWASALMVASEARSALERYRRLVGDPAAEADSDKEIADYERRLNLVASLYGDWGLD